MLNYSIKYVMFRFSVKGTGHPKFHPVVTHHFVDVGSLTERIPANDHVQ